MTEYICGKFRIDRLPNRIILEGILRLWGRNTSLPYLREMKRETVGVKMAGKLRSVYKALNREYQFRIHTISVHFKMRVGTAAVLLILLGITLPLFITERSLGILEKMIEALMEDSASLLLSASMRLVFLNIVRSTPFYIGILLLSQAVYFEPPNYILSSLKYLLSFVILIGLYRLVWMIYGIRYVVKLPAILVLILAARIRLFPVRLSNRIVVISLLLLSVQGMDIMPGMEHFGFGLGEIAMDIKQASKILRCDGVLTTFSILLFVIFTVSALLLTMLSNEKQQLQNVLTAKNNMEKMLIEAQLQAAEMRCDREMQSLVHDLKSPLTTIQGLASLTCSMTEDATVQRYQQRLSDAAERMGRMISEILYADQREEIDMATFVKRVLSHFSSNEHAEWIQTENECPNCVIDVNPIRMIRAVINVLDNACNAIEDREHAKVVFRCEEDENHVLLSVFDNGRGISETELEKIWQVGYSGRVSTGLGLAFVKQVVEGHGGTIRIESRENVYTKVTICLARLEGKTNG